MLKEIRELASLVWTATLYKSSTLLIVELESTPLSLELINPEQHNPSLQPAF
jgi:hypothetical protein